MESVDGVSSAAVPAHMDGDSLWHGDSMLGWGGVSCQDAQASRSGRVLLLSASPLWTTICCRHRVVCGALAPRSVSVKLSFCLVHAPAPPIPLIGAEGIKLRLRGPKSPAQLCFSCSVLYTYCSGNQGKRQEGNYVVGLYGAQAQTGRPVMPVSQGLSPQAYFIA